MSSDDRTQSADRPFRHPGTGSVSLMWCAMCAGHTATTDRRLLPVKGLPQWVCAACVPKHPVVARITEKMLAAASQPEGVTREQVAAMIGTKVRNVMRAIVAGMLQAGKLVQALDPSDGRCKRLFTSDELARAWVKSCKPRAPKSPDRSRQAVAKRAAEAAAKKKNARPPAGLHDPKKQRAAAHWSSLPSKSAPQSVVIPPGLHAQVLPSNLSYDARYQVDPSTRVVRGFASMGPGRYLDGSV
jgi:hypothetical protein